MGHPLKLLPPSVLQPANSQARQHVVSGQMYTYMEMKIFERSSPPYEDFQILDMLFISHIIPHSTLGIVYIWCRRGSRVDDKGNKRPLEPIHFYLLQYAEKQRTYMSFLFWKISENGKISHKNLFSTMELWFMLKKHPELG
jgi:hypothetical protein